MEKQKQSEKKKIKPLKLTLSIILVLILLLGLILLIAVPTYISSAGGKKTILSKINQSVEGRANFSNLSMGWFKGIKIDNFSYDDNSGFATVKVKQISTKPHYVSLLGGSLSLGKTVIDQPRVNINLQNKPELSPKKEKSEISTESPELPIKKVDLYINDGDISVRGGKNNTVRLAGINSHFDMTGIDKNNLFAVDMKVSNGTDGAKLNAEGSINPAKISGNVKIQLDGLEIETLAPIFDLAEVDILAKGKVDADIETEIKDSQLEKLIGTISGSAVDISGDVLKGNRLKTNTLQLETQLKRSKDLMDIENLALNTDWASMNATGQLPTTFDSLEQFISPKADYILDCDLKVDLSQAATQMPTLFKLQSGTTITSGTLTANINSTIIEQKRQITANANLSPLAGIVNNKSVSLSQPIEAQANITSSSSGINYDRIQINSSFVQINCSGTEKLLAYEANADLTKLQSELGQFIKLPQYNTNGKLLAKGRLKSDKDAITITASSSIENLIITSTNGQIASDPKINSNMDIDIFRKTGSLDIKDLDVIAGFGSVKIENGSLPGKDSIAKNISLPVKANIDLNKVEQFARLSSAYPQKMRLAGLLDSNLNITGSEKSMRIKTTGTTIKNLSITTPKTKPLVQELVTVDLDSQIEPDNKIIKCKLDGNHIKVDTDIRHTIENNNATLLAKADCDYNWQFISQIISAFMPDLKIEGQNKTTLDFASSYPADKYEMLLANGTLKPFTIGFDKAQYLGFTTDEPTKLKVEINKGLMTIPQTTMKVNQGSFNFAGKADFKQTPTLMTMTGPQKIIENVNIDETISIFKYINPIFNDVHKLSGKANFSCNTLVIPLKGASKKDLIVDGTFSVSDMVLESRTFDLIQKVGGRAGKYNKMELLPTAITVADAKVRYDNMQLNAGDKPFNFVGRIDLMTKSVEGSKAITPYRIRGGAIDVGQEDSPGRIKGVFVGTYDKPRIDWGKSLIETGIQDILKDQIGDEGELKDKIGDILNRL